MEENKELTAEDLMQDLQAAASKLDEENRIKLQTGPLSEKEFIELRTHLEGIKTFLPEHLMTPFWNWCNRIRGLKTNQPCGCKSAAKHWGACVEELRKFVRERSE